MAFFTSSNLMCYTSNSTTQLVLHNHPIFPTKLPRNLTPRHLAPKISCNKAHAREDDTKKNPETTNCTNSMLDRRNMLISLGGLYGSMNVPPIANADPSNPDVNHCNPTQEFDNKDPGGLPCCPPKYPDINKIPVFNPKNYPSPKLRLRPPAHKAGFDKEYLEKLEKGLRLMRALPSSDPRSLLQQSYVHCAYCDGSYLQLGYPNNNYVVHNSWLFFPFHRCFIYFFERILGKLIGDHSFAIPYWNWDHPDGMTIPTIYANKNSPLYDPNRNPKHNPPALMDLNYHVVDEDVPRDEQIQWNLCYMYTNVVGSPIAPLFMGRKYLAGDVSPNQPGTLELCPHNIIHRWSADPRQPYGQDMGADFSAARDPIFYAHHANVDRIWTIWNKLDGGRPNWNAPDFNNAYFVFYDENANPVKIYVKDTFDTIKLGYDYADSPVLWKQCPPSPPLLHRQPRLQGTPTRVAREKLEEQGLDKVVRTLVKRKETKRSKEEKNKLVEVLSLDVEVLKEDIYAKFDVYVNDYYEHEINKRSRPSINYAGSYASFAHKNKHHGEGDKIINVKFAVGKLIEDIGADEDEELEVVLVPRTGKEAIKIKDVKVELVSSSVTSV